MQIIQKIIVDSKIKIFTGTKIIYGNLYVSYITHKQHLSIPINVYNLHDSYNDHLIINTLFFIATGLAMRSSLL